MLLRAFPGRTLDELDNMDWPRYLRAVKAGNVQRIEERYSDYLAKRIDSKSIDKADWETIERHNKLFDEFFGNGG